MRHETMRCSRLKGVLERGVRTSTILGRMARFDKDGKEALRSWPAYSEKLWPPSRSGGVWLRGQPVDGVATGPRLTAAGMNTFRTQPDGLWLFLAPDHGFADCVAIEVCGTGQNFSDKRSRYMPSTSAILANCPRAWLNGSVSYKSGTRERWRLAGLKHAPTDDLRLPARFVRVLFFLADELYEAWRLEGVPAAHEFVASYSSIKSYKAQTMQSFLRRMSPEQHFYHRR